ncbi:hypothetical protein [Cellulomonas phragmiteti]|uniref:Uncharacterized protein n=1 Tax=Cellulomonas phragmiteti TaxID=478780 RepID=A0ABQ4DPC5_9CELL|nr:hypothetical protein [Cellulomonas phragmiteti]GIG40791.1 hypothetical protein Cph01nite_25530 [Cellulomonas phragmiteti]
MSPHRRPSGTPAGAAPSDDELAARIADALQRRATVAPDPATVGADLASAVARRTSPRAVAVRRSGRILTVGVVTGTIAVGAAGAAAAANPFSGVAVAVEDAARTVGLDVSFLPKGHSREQYDAFWAAGYDVGEVDALSKLWGTDLVETKSRAGQMLLDGVELPVAPGSVAYVPFVEGEDEVNAFFASGYTYEDAEALGALWGIEAFEAKARAGQAVLDGEELPIAPGSSPTPAEYGSRDDRPRDDGPREGGPPAAPAPASPTDTPRSR